MNIQPRYLSRKFLLTCYFSIAATAALFTHYLSGSEFVEISLTILGAHHIANYFDSKSPQ
jgi:hypothetical protein